MSSEFNLIVEPLIKVRTVDCQIIEVSFRELFENAHNYEALCGESEPQNVAVLRIILAVVHTVFSRYDLDGNRLEKPPQYTQELWKRLWNKKKFPMAAFDSYFKEWHDNFYLFDDEKPFLQNVGFKNFKSEYKIATDKLIGTIMESDNKARLFAERKGEGRKLGYAEAARWLINVHAYDDRGTKPVPRKPWVSTLGLVVVLGDNLFETIMLNYIPEPKESTPTWEKVLPITDKKPEDKNAAFFPDNQAELLSTQARRILLLKEDGFVTGAKLLPGEFFTPSDGFRRENMTLWKRDETEETNLVFKPKMHDLSKSAWHEFGMIAGIENLDSSNEAAEGCEMPGVISYIKDLVDDEILDVDFMLRIMAAGMGYNEGQATSRPVNNMFHDNITFHAALMSDPGFSWRKKINEEIKKCDEASKCVWTLSTSIQKANGASDSEKSKLDGSEAKRQFYAEIDQPFREWLAEINPDSDVEQKLIELEKKLRKIALSLSDRLAESTGVTGIIGRTVVTKDKNGNEKREHYSVPEAQIFFKAKMNEVFGYALIGGDDNE